MARLMQMLWRRKRASESETSMEMSCTTVMWKPWGKSSQTSVQRSGWCHLWGRNKEAVGKATCSTESASHMQKCQSCTVVLFINTIDKDPQHLPCQDCKCCYHTWSTIHTMCLTLIRQFQHPALYFTNYSNQEWSSSIPANGTRIKTIKM